MTLKELFDHFNNKNIVTYVRDTKGSTYEEIHVFFEVYQNSRILDEEVLEWHMTKQGDLEVKVTCFYG